MFKHQNTKLTTWLLSGLFVVLSVFTYNFALPAPVAAEQVDCTTTKLQGKDYREACGCQGSLSPENCGIVAYLQLFIRVLSGIVGVVVVMTITFSGIQYSTARDNPQAAQAARVRIYNSVFALVIYLFIFAFLQWIVPGGVV